MAFLLLHNYTDFIGFFFLFQGPSLPLRQSWIFFVKPKGKYLPFAP